MLIVVAFFFSARKRDEFHRIISFDVIAFHIFCHWVVVAVTNGEMNFDVAFRKDLTW